MQHVLGSCFRWFLPLCVEHCFFLLLFSSLPLLLRCFLNLAYQHWRILRVRVRVSKCSKIHLIWYGSILDHKTSFLPPSFPICLPESLLFSLRLTALQLFLWPASLVILECLVCMSCRLPPGWWEKPAAGGRGGTKCMILGYKTETLGLNCLSTF